MNPETNKSQTALKEEEILKFWKDKDIFKKTLEKDSPKGEYIFYEGPPTANGKPGIHHIEARSFKDIIPRYKTMQGFHVRRKGGWDTHGLPVELQVEKALGLKSKKEKKKQIRLRWKRNSRFEHKHHKRFPYQLMFEAVKNGVKSKIAYEPPQKARVY